MSSAEKTRVLVFMVAVVMVYACAIRLLIESVLERRRQRAGSPPHGRLSWWKRVLYAGGPPGRWTRAARAVSYTLCLLGSLCVAYGFVVEPYWLQVTQERIETAKLAAGVGPIRIAHISDLHCDPVERVEEEMVAALRKERPDVIVFTGDCVNSRSGLPLFKKTLKAVAAIAPTYVCRGNWDVWYWHQLDLFGGTGAKELDGTGEFVDVRGARIWIGGAAFDTPLSIGKAFAKLPKDTFSIFLYHSPDLLLAAATHGADLFLTGHTHGGQIAMPWYGALVTLTDVGKRFESGRYEVGATVGYVNRGLGMEGGPMPRVRFCARPELTMFEVVPAASR